MDVYDKHGNILASLKPGESAWLDLSTKDVWAVSCGLEMRRTSSVRIEFEGPMRGYYQGAQIQDFETKILQAPLSSGWQYSY